MEKLLRDLSFSVAPEKPLCIIGTGSSGKFIAKKYVRAR